MSIYNSAVKINGNLNNSSTNDRTTPHISVLCEDVDYSSDDSSSSSGDEIFLDDYTTRKFAQSNQNSGDFSRNLDSSKQVKSNLNNLGIIFERSEESSVSSQSTLVQDDLQSPRLISANHVSDSNDDIINSQLSNQPMNYEKNIVTKSSLTEPIFDLDIDDSLGYNHNDMRNDIATDTHTIDTLTNLRDAYKQVGVYDWSTINTNKPTPISQSELIFNRRTPRFHIKNNSNDCVVECERISLIDNSNFFADNNQYMQKTYQTKKPDLPKKPTKDQLAKNIEKDIITDLDDCGINNVNEVPNRSSQEGASHDDNLPKSGSYFKHQMYKSYSKADLKVHHRYDKRGEAKKTDLDTGMLSSHDKNSPSRRSQEITGSIMKMDKTIDCVNNNINKIDNVLNRMSTFNRDFISSLEKESDAELLSDFDTQSIGAQTEVVTFISTDPRAMKRPPIQQRNSSSTDDSSTEKDSDSDDDDSGSLKPSPMHQMLNNKLPVNRVTSPNEPKTLSRTVANLKTQVQQDSDLSSLPDSSVCSEPEKRALPEKVDYFQRQAKKNAGLYKKPPNLEAPKRLIVEETVRSKPISKPVIPPVPKPRNSIDGSQQGTLNRQYSTSSSESSITNEYQRTLSNSNSKNQSGHSPGNSDSGSFISTNSSNNQLGKRFQKGGTSGRYQSKNNIGDKYGTGAKIRNKDDDEAASLSGKYDPNRNPNKRYMTQSRSYNSLNAINSRLDSDPLRSGSLAALNSNEEMENFNNLCSMIQQYLNLNKHEQIRAIFTALIRDNEHDKIEDIIDHFEGRNRNILKEIAGKAGYGLNDTESIFDMTMSRTDLHNNLRPGLSVSTLNDSNYYQHTIGTDRMVIWRPDIEELFPPPMKPAPKPMPTNLLKAAIITQESLAHIDNNVIEFLGSEPTTFTELVMFLTRDCSNDVEKVRALFRWITMYDMKHLTFDPAAPNDTLIGVLRAVKSGQMSYNELFFQMCRFAGIHCQYICGYSKGAGYKPGMTIKDNRMFRNVWTAVFVAGAWRFVNCNWGARYLSSNHHNPVSFGTLNSNINNQQNIENKYRCDEFYFLTDPKQHIFEHFPDKKRWQLLNRPITLDQFMALPIVKSPFFNANLSFKRNYAETLQTKNGKVTVKINMPKAVGISCRLENSSDNSIIRGLTLVQVLDNQMIMVTAAPSQPGKFYLSIYVSDDWITEEGREMACSFQVHCSEHNYDRLMTGRFPEVGVLGATPAAQNLGVVVNAGVNPFVIWDERSTMKLNLVIGPGLRISHKMMSYERSGQNSAPCDSYALLQSQQSQGRYQYHLRFPLDAFYCLTIYGGVCDPHMPETEPMECIYRLLVDCRQAQDRIEPFPRQTSRWVGFRLIEPLSQHLELNKVIRFRVWSTLCSSMVVVINDSEWYDLTSASDGLWKAKINTGQELDTLSVYGKFGVENEDDDEEFTKLLDYVLITSTKKK